LARKSKTDISDSLHPQTKIIATIGPSCNEPAIIGRLVEAGVNIFRFNFSHGYPGQHLKSYRLVRRTAKSLKVNIAILQDLPGPKIRVGKLPAGYMELIEGKQAILTTANHAVSPKIPVNYHHLNKDLKPGKTIFLDDGKIELRVDKIRHQDIHCEVIAGGILKEHKGINLPDTTLSISSPTRIDFKLLDLGVKAGFDFVALSFVRSANDIKRARKFLAKKNKNIFIIAKIEKFEALDRLDEIIARADGIMVARGDLGVEIPIEIVPTVQRMIIDKCNLAGKPVITATQILESMIERPNPTRAEATDIANAVINGTDALMLSGETAVGKYPVKAVAVLKKIALQAEQFARWKNLTRINQLDNADITDIVSRAAVEAAYQMHPKLILTPTRSGKTSHYVSRYKPGCPIIAFTSNDRTYKELVLSWGVQTFKIDQKLRFTEIVRKMKAIVKENGLAKAGDLVIITAGSPDSRAGQTNLVMAEKIK
jgi:pyruvate kinase